MTPRQAAGPDTLRATAEPTDGNGPGTGAAAVAVQPEPPPAPDRRRRGTVAIPAAVSGLSLAASLPPWGWWPLAFVGAGLLVWRLRGLRWRSRLFAGWVAGLGCFVPGLWWAATFSWYGAVVLMAVEAATMAVAALVVPPDRCRVPAAVGAFTLLEAVRLSWPFGGLPLGGVFLGQAGGPLLGSARLGGPLLLTALVWLGGAGLATLATGVTAAVRARRWPRCGTSAVGVPVVAGAAQRRSAGPLLTGAAAVGLVGVVALAGAVAPAGGPATSSVTVVAVQGGGRRGAAGGVDPATVLAAQVAATARLRPRSAGGPPLLVVWPEDVVAVGPHLAGSPEAALMASIARRLGATVVAGVTETVSTTAFRNEAVAWGPGGRVVGVYEKVHRVPFGEYVPDRSFFAHLANLSAVPLDAVPGHGSGLLRTPAGPLGLMVSYEVFFADRGRSAVRAGARLLVVPTNTSSYATDQVPADEVAADRVQAVAEGRDLVQAAPAGYSTVIGATGRVLHQSRLGRRQVLVATVALRDGHTVYEELGDLPVLVGAAAALGWVVLARLRRKRRSVAQPLAQRR